mgnify:CR=1 FL=1
MGHEHRTRPVRKLGDNLLIIHAQISRVNINEYRLKSVLDDRGNESIQRLNDRAQKSITNDEIVHSKNKDTWNPTAMKTLSYLDRGGRYHIPVGYIVSKKDRRKKAAKKAAGGFAKALAKAAIEQQSKGAISFEKNPNNFSITI